MTDYNETTKHHFDCPRFHAKSPDVICTCNDWVKNMTPKVNEVPNINMDKVPIKNGSPLFYALLKSMSNLHDRKSHDYASNNDPYANYRFAGKLSKLFNNPDDSGFLGRLAEKIYRLANLENSNKTPSNESIEDTELDLCVIMTLWMASRRDSRMHGGKRGE